MAIRIPTNQIIYKYTSGKEYMNGSTYTEYQGYYYELNGKIFAGKTFNSNAPELIPFPKDNNTSVEFNSLLTKAATYVYGRVSNTKINNEIPLSFVFNYNSDVRYFIYQINKNQIKEVNEDTFNSIQKDPLFTSAKLNFISGFNEQELNIAEQKIPGIKDFVNTSYTPPPVEDDGTIG